MSAPSARRRTQGETLEPTGSSLPKQLIIGAQPDEPPPEQGGKSSKKPSVKIIEIGEDGAFELPDNNNEEADDDDDDEPPPMEEEEPSPMSSGSSPSPPQAEEPPSVMDELLAEANAARAKVKEKAAAEEKRVKKEFGTGLKGGFFNKPKAEKKPATKGAVKATSSTAPNKKPAAAAAPIETVRPLPKAAVQKAKVDSLVMEEVQAAMKAGAGPMGAALADKDKWMTPALLQKFATNPKLARGMTDPKCQAAIAELQKNPKVNPKSLLCLSECTLTFFTVCNNSNEQAAMEKFQHDKDLTAFLTEFCTTMGEHFSHVRARLLHIYIEPLVGGDTDGTCVAADRRTRGEGKEKGGGKGCGKGQSCGES